MTENLLDFSDEEVRIRRLKFFKRTRLFLLVVTLSPSLAFWDSKVAPVAFFSCSRPITGPGRYTLIIV
jgi:hypothetical protein